MSAAQSAAGWDRRIRSYSMNAMVGNAGDFSSKRFQHQQSRLRPVFQESRKFRSPAEIFVFLDEHPDSINDGYFLNKSTEYASGGSYGGQAYSYGEWLDLPATYHNNATAFSFADGHSTLHRWMIPSTSYPVQPDVANLPIPISANQRGDFEWVLDHMSVDHD